MLKKASEKKLNSLLILSFITTYLYNGLNIYIKFFSLLFFLIAWKSLKIIRV